MIFISFYSYLAVTDGFDCFFFHDVDLISENDHNLYECFDNPRHYSAWIDKWNYKILYGTIFGGITAYTEDAFRKINGYSNEYWGWGGEDDDLYKRTSNSGFSLMRPEESVTRYKMIKHGREATNKPNPLRVQMINKFQKHWKNDGLSV